jgi:hypothetical protein
MNRAQERKVRQTTIRLALGAMAFAAAAFNAMAEKQQALQLRNLTPRTPSGEDVAASRNGGPGRGNRAYQRAAQKRRNVIRHRRACRG